MEEDKKTIKKQGLEITILSIVVVVLLGVCIYMLFIKKDEKSINNNENKQQVNNVTQNDGTDNFKPWMKYILEQNITKIELSKVPCSDDNFEKKTVVINVNQLKEIFKKFMNYQLRVHYSGGRGWDCGETLNIKYLKNGEEYELTYLGIEGFLGASTDDCATLSDTDLENVLYSSSDIKNEEFKNQDNICVMYDLLAPDYFLFDEYFK